MALFLPSAAVDKVTEITPQMVRSMKACALILDVDNTLAENGSQVPLEGALDWVKFMRAQDVKIIILSNNHAARVAPFAAQFELPFLSMAMKPLPFGYHRAARELGVRPRDAVVVGDQIFTDVLGANLAFMKSILLVPVKGEESASFIVRRRLEKPLRRYIVSSRRGRKYFE